MKCVYLETLGCIDGNCHKCDVVATDTTYIIKPIFETTPITEELLKMPPADGSTIPKELCKIGTGNIQIFTNEDLVADAIACSITELPAADVQKVRHGHWDDNKVAFHRVCSECGAVVRQDISLVYLLGCMEKVGALNYCPNCGAKMDGEQNE